MCACANPADFDSLQDKVSTVGVASQERQLVNSRARFIHERIFTWHASFHRSSANSLGTRFTLVVCEQTHKAVCLDSGDSQ